MLGIGSVCMTPITWIDKEKAFKLKETKEAAIVKEGTIGIVGAGPLKSSYFKYYAYSPKNNPKSSGIYDFQENEKHQPRISPLQGLKCFFGDDVTIKRNDNDGITRFFACSADKKIVDKAYRDFKKSLAK
jgi:hypothetical protein